MEPWRGVVNSVLYCVQFSSLLDGGEVERMSRMLLDEPYSGMTAAEQYTAIAEALTSGAELGGDWQPHGEPEVRDFLRRLLDRLDALRPWQDPPFLALDCDVHWPRFRHGTAIARLHLMAASQDPLAPRMRRLRDAGRELRVLILRLRPGDELALVVPQPRTLRPWRRGVPDEATLLVPEPHRPPGDVLAAFLEHTRYPPERVTGAPPAPGG